MSFFIDYTNVRPGNRGGRDQFKWEDVTLKSYKDREMYLGGATKMGFLSSGGKWRKKDWWLTYNPETQPKDNTEFDKIKQEELDLIYEAAGAKRDKSVNKNQQQTQNKQVTKETNEPRGKLTAFEWNELIKKEGKFNPDDAKLFEFYQNDEKKRGLGMKPQISFRTNPFAKDVVNNMQKLEGYNYQDKETNVKEIENKETEGVNGGISNEYGKTERSKSKSLSSPRRRSRSRSYSRSKDKKHKSKKHKKDKCKHNKDKKHKKDKDKY